MSTMLFLSVIAGLVGEAWSQTNLAPARANNIVPYTSFSAPKAGPKIPSYVDCREDRLVLYPGKIAVGWEELQQSENALNKMLDKIQANASSEYLIVMVRPRSVIFYRWVRMMVSRRRIDVGYDAVDAEFKVDCEEAVRASAIESPVPKRAAPRAIPITHSAVFIECRGNQMFFVDNDGLDVQVTEVLSKLDPKIKRTGSAEFLRALQANEIGNENYKVDSKYLQKGILSLEAREGVRGENLEQIEQPSGKFQTVLSHLDPNKKYIAFLVRADSFEVFRLARQIADERGFATSWELLGADEPIKFGAGSGPVSIGEFPSR